MNHLLDELFKGKTKAWWSTEIAREQYT